MHIPQFKRRLVDKHRFFTLDTLTEVNAFCSILPGPSTTQTITILGWKQGGPMMAFFVTARLGFARREHHDNHRAIAHIPWRKPLVIHAANGGSLFSIFRFHHGKVDQKIHTQLLDIFGNWNYRIPAK